MNAPYKLGAEQALTQFGLNHGTPKPPATWSQKWQNERVTNVKKSVTIPSMKEGPAK